MSSKITFPKPEENKFVPFNLVVWGMSGSTYVFENSTIQTITYKVVDSNSNVVVEGYILPFSVSQQLSSAQLNGNNINVSETIDILID